MRNAYIERKTKETDIKLTFSLDGGNISVDTGIGFFDHMLNSFAFHGGFGMTLSATGDLAVDCHHTVEDVGIVLGTAFCEAVGSRIGIKRFAHAYVPMDEALAFAAADISGRPFMFLEAEFPQPRVGSFDTCMVTEFFRAFAQNAGVTLHLRACYGTNSHHIIEALFKATAHTLRDAATIEGDEVRSTKGML